MPNPLLDISSLPRFATIEPEHVVPAISELIAQHRQKLGALLDANPDPDFEALVPAIEEMVSTIKNLSIGFCRAVSTRSLPPGYFPSSPAARRILPHLQGWL